MKFFISQTEVAIVDGKLTGFETVLTKPDTEKATREMIWRMKRIGVPNIHLCKHPAKSRRYGKLLHAQNKRTRAARDLTGAEVAEILADDLTTS